MNKENTPSTPTRSLTSSSPVDYSASSAKMVLKPISPNKNAGGNGVGKLNFLQSDNIDEHFEQIHSAQVVLSQQLYNLEVQTKQTNVDLGQLFDRSKNNNQHLNRLLENIANYSEEVITEGNATKQDIREITTKLDSLRDIQNSKILHSLESSLHEIKTRDSRSNSEAPEESEQLVKKFTTSVKGEVSDIVSKIDGVEKLLKDTIATSHANPEVEAIEALLEDVKASLKEVLEAKTVDSKKLDEVLDAHSVTTRSVEDKIETLHGKVIETITSNVNSKLTAQSEEHKKKYAELKEQLSSIRNNLPESDLARQIIDPIVAELKSVSLDSKSVSLLESILNRMGDKKSENDYNDAFYNEVRTGLSEIVRLSEEKNGKLDDLAKRLESKEALIKEGSSLNSLSEQKTELEKTILTLESNYNAMTIAYEKKYNDFKKLQEDYLQLASNIATISTNSPTDRPSKLAKIRQLHESNLSEIQGNSRTTTNHSKRVMSTPLLISGQRQLNTIEPVLEQSETTNNSDDDGF
ncbi:uncharacterized protein RJT20DRAFT_30895 [Scheffersomyces xylosifermentans]|uniref:uncharacterized protein n=1 Tax=Scheffersomyces xylosifermentans TaxID=1304137 RepID=UPI00315D9CD6